LWFWFAFHRWLRMLNSFLHVPVGHLYVLFGKKNTYVYLCPSPIFLLLLSYMIFLYIWLLTPYRMYDLHIFSPIQLVIFVSFSFFSWLFAFLCRNFFVWNIPTCLFCFYFVYFWYVVQSIIIKINVKELIPMFTSRRFTVSGFNFQVINKFWIDFGVWCKIPVSSFCTNPVLITSNHIQILIIPHYLPH